MTLGMLFMPFMITIWVKPVSRVVNPFANRLPGYERRNWNGKIVKPTALLLMGHRGRRSECLHRLRDCKAIDGSRWSSHPVSGEQWTTYLSYQFEYHDITSWKSFSWYRWTKQRNPNLHYTIEHVACAPIVICIVSVRVTCAGSNSNHVVVCSNSFPNTVQLDSDRDHVYV